MSEHHKTFYGRRRGRPLRVAKTHAMETLLPGLRITFEEGRPLDPRAFFPGHEGPLWFEIGFGGGEHLAGLVRDHKDTCFVGSEVFLNGVASILTQVAPENVSRVRVYPEDVRPMVETLTSASFARIFVMFPDPWPKARHAKRRLLQTPFFEELARLLVPGGTLHVASDHADYVEHILEHARAAKSLTLLGDESTWSTPFFEGRYPTRYEAKAKEAGRLCQYFMFEKDALSQ